MLFVCWLYFLVFFVKLGTSPKTNMEPKNRALEDVFSFVDGVIFGFQPLDFGGALGRGINNFRQNLEPRILHELILYVLEVIATILKMVVLFG